MATCLLSILLRAAVAVCAPKLGRIKGVLGRLVTELPVQAHINQLTFNKNYQHIINGSK